MALALLQLGDFMRDTPIILNVPTPFHYMNFLISSKVTLIPKQ